MWLDEIEILKKRVVNAIVTHSWCGANYFEDNQALAKMVDHEIQRMAHVLRELGEYARLNEIALLDNGLTLLHANRINLSDDAKELLG